MVLLGKEGLAIAYAPNTFHFRRSCLFVYILLLVLMGASLLWAGRSDFAAGNIRDGKLMLSMGACSLLAGGVLFIY